MNKTYLFPAIIIFVICLFIGAEELGFFQMVSDSPKWGWILNDMANPYMSPEQVASFTEADRRAWWTKVINDPETKWSLEMFGAPYMDTIPADLRAQLDLLHEEKKSDVSLFDFDRGELRMKYSASDKRGYVVSPAGKIISLTELTEEGLKIQKENGCDGCH